MNLPWQGFNRALPVQHYQSMCNQVLTFELCMLQAVLKRATVTCIVTKVVAGWKICKGVGSNWWGLVCFAHWFGTGLSLPRALFLGFFVIFMGWLG